MKSANPYEAKCLRCGHTWLKRPPTRGAEPDPAKWRPPECPNCKQRNWDKHPMSRQEVGQRAAAARWAKEPPAKRPRRRTARSTRGR